MNTGIVYLIGAGPGDPKLITVGGMDALKIADVIVYDRLAHPKLLDSARLDAEKIYVGKQAERHAMKQDDINALLAENARAGKTVARLKGGDPFVFGRGGEEAEYLRQRGVAFVVIPGVTSAIAAPAYAGIPVTHRDLASSFAVITGHERGDGRESGTRAPGEAEQRRRWDKIAYAADTLLFLMGVENLDEIASQLLANGRDSATPVALVRWGTWAGSQEVLTGMLGDIVQKVCDANFQAPAVTIVGEVVSLREKLRWFDVGPLAGKRVVVTRARAQSSEFAELLRAKNAEPIEFPIIQIVPPSDEYAALDASIVCAATFDWICFASAPAVHAFFSRLQFARKDLRVFASSKFAAVGPATAAALAFYRVAVDFAPSEATGKSLADELPGDIDGANVLVPRAKIGEESLTDGLTERGAAVDSPTAYENVPDAANAAEIRKRIAAGTIDAVTFTSSSTVKNFAETLGNFAMPSTVVIACIGPTTAKTATETFGRAPDIVAPTHTVDGLLEALETYFDPS